MSRRLIQYRQFKRDTVDETQAAIVHAHRHTHKVGKRLTLDAEGKLISGSHSSLPVSETKALRLAQTLHRKKV